MKGKRELLESIQDELVLSNIRISNKAFSIIKKYNIKYAISVADALIIATAIENKLPLYTDNLNDYSFIKKLQLYKTKQKMKYTSADNYKECSSNIV